ncbi:flagellar motor switch protein FliG [Pseudaminobacter arsenicus]|uniref:Flagellar motor switch protein FliG n=1 Tax=Borborobacter arsenicus TaxID=1851146 RepID=A0A432V5Y8_9HYPH|nr:flagellar motor switch protein FliG [Pseudaminobacter arsenicus]RUM97558.1 flagellar motor switch protein FliG [Pseudaminobacter arsenicus]
MSTPLATLTRAQKAAAILVAMGKPSASKLLKFFKQEELKALIEGARLLRTIPQGDLEKIVAEFEAEFTEGAGLLDSADKMDTILNESLSPEEVDAIMSGAKPVVAPEPPQIWNDLERLDPARIGAFLAVEHPQTAALILSRLAPPFAANVLLTLGKPMRGDVIRRMLSMTTIQEAASRIVENQLRSRVLAENTGKDISAGQSRVASLLNEMDKEHLEEVMQDLEATGATDLDGIRARLFSFEDIVLLTQKARVALFDGLSTELVTLCLRGADAALTEAVLSSIGARSRRMIESELGQASDGIAAADIADARRTVASTAIRMSVEGAFELPSAQNAA